MAAMFSILHISDLHRSREEPVDNDSLVAALLADRDRYMGEPQSIPTPGAIVVSGDLIQGAPIGHPHWQTIMDDQYRVAGDFLDHLARRFLGGDRSKLIIIPGNHDVCWNTSLGSMERVPEAEYPDDVRRALVEPESNYRWSWGERALYRIKDSSAYASRMNSYWTFAENFYAGVPLRRPIDRLRGYQLFELYNRRIVVAAFDSIAGNDCFATSGSIPRGAVARCDLELRDIPHSYDLRVALWHHSIYGPPLRDDYMEIGQVHEMAGLHFQLGMHGHQHVAAATTHYVYLSETQSMGVVSAGSLCAGSQELPRGVNRQYNLIVIEDDLRRARVYVREMVGGGQFTRKNNGPFAQGYVELSWQPSTDAMGRAIDAHEQNIRRATALADEALHSSNPRQALDLLEQIKPPPGSHGHRIAIEAALKLEEWTALARIIGEPDSAEEAILLVTALVRMNSFDQADKVLSGHPEIDPKTRKELKGLIETARMVKHQ
jgi:3',5'-cyclic AMP phosphodiesterase CpdA